MSYRLGYIFGTSVIISAFLHFPSLNRSFQDSITIWFLIAVMLFSGIQILRKKDMGWILFIGSMGVAIGFQLFAALQSRHFQVSIYLMGYYVWWLFGVGYWLWNRKRLS